MDKSVNGKKGKVPKITEAEYAAYLDRLKGMSDECAQAEKGCCQALQPRKEE
jgi:hypothetical protein